METTEKTRSSIEQHNEFVDDVRAQKKSAEPFFIAATPAEEEAVIRKLDWGILPLVFLLYSFSVLDRSNLGNAKLAGLEEDVDLSGWNYNWLGTMFYIACEFACSSHIQS